MITDAGRGETKARQAPPNEATPFIRVRDLCKAFGEQSVLRGVDLEITRGETLVLIGPSGEGKSVLLKHIIGLLSPDRGSVEFDGLELVGRKERQLSEIRRRMGYLFQNAALFDSLTVGQNVAFPLLEAGIKPPSEIKKRVREALEVVELESHIDKMPINLSGGMRKRVGIARAVIGRPEIILYDEPTAGLDPIVTDVIDHLIQRMQKLFGVTSVIITHDLNSVFKIADRVAMLKDGVVRFNGTVEQLRGTTDEFIQDFIAGRSGMSS